VTVPVHAPTAAAAEIDRVGAHPAMVGVIVTAGSRLPYGNEVYHPIWAACARHDLPLVLHHGGTGMHLEGAPTAAGWPSTYLEWSAAMPQAAMAQVVSLVSEGVFDRFPDLRVVLLEVGFAWLPHLLWRFDKNWKALRSEVPWVRRPPSAYIRRHVRFSSQPLERPASDEQFQRLLQIVDAERSVLFGSGYPGWDADTPAAVLPAFPAAIRARVMADNAREVFRLDGGANGAAHGD
jgi:uncharacterized protein